MSTKPEITLPDDKRRFVRDVLGYLIRAVFNALKYNLGTINYGSSQDFKHRHLQFAQQMLSAYLDYRNLSKINVTSNVALFQNIYALACMMHIYDAEFNTDYATSPVETALSNLQISDLDRGELENQITMLAMKIEGQISGLKYIGGVQTIPPTGW